jgi:hypothetical protein
VFYFRGEQKNIGAAAAEHAHASKPMDAILGRSTRASGSDEEEMGTVEIFAVVSRQWELQGRRCGVALMGETGGGNEEEEKSRKDGKSQREVTGTIGVVAPL